MSYCYCDKNKIALHLQQRFKSRFNIELTRELRLSILDQIKTKKAECCFKSDKSEFWRVFIINKIGIIETFDIIYSRQEDIILTVLPPIGSDEFDEFAEKLFYSYGIKKDQIIFRRKTSKELEMESIRKRIDFEKRVDIGRQRLKQWKIIQSYENKVANLELV